MTTEEAKTICASVGLTLKWTAWDEWRVAPNRTWTMTDTKREECAYYTTDLTDAVETARVMSIDLAAAGYSRVGGNDG